MKRISRIGAAIVVALVVFSYFSPHLTLYQMKRAIDNRDADAFSDHVDFPSLRESFKGQMMASLSNTKDQQQDKENPFSALGQALATAFMGPMIDAMVSPAGVIAMMNTGKPVSPAEVKNAATQPADADKTDRPNYSISYKGWSRAVVRASDANANSVGFILKRDGLWSWKLAGVEMHEQGLMK